MSQTLQLPTNERPGFLGRTNERLIVMTQGEARVARVPEYQGISMSLLLYKVLQSVQTPIN